MRLYCVYQSDSVCHFSCNFRYFTFLVDCESPKACTILLRGASKDVLAEVERNLQDAMNVARNVMVDPRLVAGGGAGEMALSVVSMALLTLTVPVTTIDALQHFETG